MGSTLPERATVPAILLETGWTYDELMEQPDEGVQAMMELLGARARVAREKKR